MCKIITITLFLILLVSLQALAADLWLPVENIQGIKIGDGIILAIEKFGNNFETSFESEYIYICYPDYEFIYNPRNSKIVEINIRIEN